MSTCTTLARDVPGLCFPNVFSGELADEVGDVSRHDVTIVDECGLTLFEQRNVEAPASWSARAVRVAASKYLWGDPAKGNDPRTGGREPSILDLHARVSRFIARKGLEQGVLRSQVQADQFERELRALTLGQYAAFNSPVWFNVGLDEYGLENDDRAWIWDTKADMSNSDARLIRNTIVYPQGSACFIQSVADNMESIMRLATSEALLFKHGSGTGTDLSPLRSRREKLTGGGTPSGPLSFARIYDRIASVVKSGGKTRRAAKMNVLSCRHPDIMDFIRAKGEEECKAHALILAGWSADFNGSAYDTVAYQNVNFSVKIADDFLDCLDGPSMCDDKGRQRPPAMWPLFAVTTGQVLAEIDPRYLWDSIALETWGCGDPGIHFEDTINSWHTCPHALDGSPQPINCSNPCSEYLFIDDSACNLASLNLLRFLCDDGTFDARRFCAAVRIMIAAMEILVDACSYPTRQIASNSHRFRPLGLGYANLGGLLQVAGLAYDSDAGRYAASLITALLTGEAYRQSARLAVLRGPFEGYQQNETAMLAVIDRHARVLNRLESPFMMGHEEPPDTPFVQQFEPLWFRARTTWGHVRSLGQQYGFRNAQVSLVAPTGTIAFTMDCDTTGLEPNLALVATKHLAGGGSMQVVNRLVPRALDTLGYPLTRIAHISDYIARYGTAEGCPDLEPQDLPVFDCALCPPGFTRVLHWSAHLEMCAAVQPFISGAPSKTVNVPRDTTPAQIADIYRKAHQLGLKCVAIYRDGSKGSQPLVPGVGSSAVTCPQCGRSELVPAGTCGACSQCGTTTGCS